MEPMETPVMPHSTEKRWRYAPNVIALGWVSFLTDMASEMLYPLIPLFLTTTLGASPAIVGLIDGVAEGISTLLRWFAGAISDHYRRRKPFIFAGYTLSALSKPLMGMAALVMGWPLFLVARIVDRVGKSIRTAPRDALIADSTPAERRGAAFGLHRAMDTAGAVAGPAVALLVLWRWPHLPLHYLFFLALVPGLGSSLLTLVMIRDVPAEKVSSGPRPAIWRRYPAAFWRVLIVIGIFSLANSSDSFLVLRSKDDGLSFVQIVMAFMLYNLMYALLSSPMGRLSDRVGRRPVIAGGWLLYAAVYAGFAILRTPLAPWVLWGLYGAYQAMSEGVSKALIGDTISARDRAGAIGLTYTIAGLAQFVASVVAGSTWGVHVGGWHLPFVMGSGLALVAVMALMLMVPLRHAAQRV